MVRLRPLTAPAFILAAGLTFAAPANADIPPDTMSTSDSTSSSSSDSSSTSDGSSSSGSGSSSSGSSSSGSAGSPASDGSATTTDGDDKDKGCTIGGGGSALGLLLVGAAFLRRRR